MDQTRFLRDLSEAKQATLNIAITFVQQLQYNEAVGSTLSSTHPIHTSSSGLGFHQNMRCRCLNQCELNVQQITPLIHLHANTNRPRSHESKILHHQSTIIPNTDVGLLPTIGRIKLQYNPWGQHTLANEQEYKCRSQATKTTNLTLKTK